MQCPGRKIVFPDLDREKLRAAGSVDLAAVLDDLEPLVADRYFVYCASSGAAGTAQPADQRLANGVVVRLDPFDLDLTVEPGDRVDS